MSERATVMPPPVRGCRMLKASPMRRAPGVGCGAAGMLRFGWVLMFPFSIAAINDSYNSSGSCKQKQKKLVSMYCQGSYFFSF